jgi:uroporphyrinogen decarboxylase
MHVIHPLESMDVREYPFPEAREEDFAVVEKFRKEYENHCVIAFAFQPFETACALFGYNAIYRAMLREPWKVEFVLDKLFALAEQLAALVADAGVDQVYSGDDAGAQTTMLISPQLWRRFLKPRYERLAHTIHKRGAFFHFHSDGWIEPIIPDIIEAGVDVLEPIQPECMDIKKVKELYGDRLSFEGGLGVQRLPFLSVEEVVREVGWLIENLGPTGYTLRPSHTILPETPVENIIAVYDAAARYARRVSSP